MSVRRLATGILAAPLLLSACGGGDDSIPDPPISSAPTSSATGTPPHESAEQFIRRFAEIERSMENTGQLAEYARVTKTCGPCKDLASQIHGFYRAGGYVHWAGWDIKSVRPYDRATKPNTFAVRVVSAPTTYRESTSGPIKHLAGGPATEIVSIRREHNAWVITGRAKLST
jgi:hypothetical protein